MKAGVKRYDLNLCSKLGSFMLPVRSYRDKYIKEQNFTATRTVVV